MFQRKIISSKIKKFACGAVFLEMTKILSKLVLWNQKKKISIDTWYQEKHVGERKEKKGKGRKMD